MPANSNTARVINILCFDPEKIFFITYFLIQLDTVARLI